MEKKLIEYLKSNLNSGVEILVDTPLLEEDLLDSFAIIDLIYFIENVFSISIPDEEFDINNFKNVSSIVQLITRLKL